MSASELGNPHSGLANLRVVDGPLECTPLGAAIVGVIEARHCGIARGSLAAILDAAEAAGFAGRADVVVVEAGPLNDEVPAALCKLAHFVMRAVRGMA